MEAGRETVQSQILSTKIQANLGWLHSEPLSKREKNTRVSIFLFILAINF